MSGPLGSSQWMYASGGYELEQSLKFDNSGQHYLTRTPAADGNRRTWTMSYWVKYTSLLDHRAHFGGSLSGSESIGVKVQFDGNTRQLMIADYRAGYNTDWIVKSDDGFRDPSAWYHIVIAIDTTQATAANRVKLYANGVELGKTAYTPTYPSQNFETKFNQNNPQIIGAQFDNLVAESFFDGYLTEMNFIDGQALTPADFGETGDYGEWKPIEYSGTYGTNGFYLPFKQDYTVEGFSTVTYRGNESTMYVGGTGFQPDLVWFKQRDGTRNHTLIDSVRGGTKQLFSNSTGTEETYATAITSFDTDGFTIGSQYNINEDNKSMVAWNWDMGGSNATNTDGSITSTVRANPTYGQSIVKWTGNGTTGHGLSSAPEMIIVKPIDVVGAWWTWHKDLSNTSQGYLQLNATAAEATNSSLWDNASPVTSTTINANTAYINYATDNYIAYCFHSVTGYSKIGSYTGNGSTTGTVVTTGFKPAWLLIKRDADEGWQIVDSTRNPNNTLTSSLSPNSNGAERDDLVDVDFTSTGFQLKGTDGSCNASGATYFYMAFADNREYAYWLDQSGNNNDWTSNSLTESDISVDSPSNNFATFNPLKQHIGYISTFSEGNLKVAPNRYYGGSSTMAMTTGKWYAEFLLTNATGNGYLGIVPTSTKAEDVIFDNVAYAYQGANGTLRDHGTNRSSWGATFTTGDLISIAVDLDNSNVYFAKNNVWQNSGVPTSGATGTGSGNASAIVADTYEFLVGDSSGAVGQSGSWVGNFGQDSSFAGNKTAQGNQDGNSIGDFYYTPPTGFLALCTSNLPDVDVVPSEHFNTITYTGTDTDNRAITGIGFAPDFAWFRRRNTVTNHGLFDVLRGPNKRLSSNLSDAEFSDSNALMSFDSDGYTVSSDGTTNAAGTYVSWNWKANGSGSSNTDGSITSTVSANVDAGFSIVSWTGNATGGATIGHGLSSAPEMVIAKNRDDNQVGYVLHTGLNVVGGSEYIQWNNNIGSSGNNVIWHSTLPSSSVITLGSENGTNGSGDAMIAYAFHSVDGYSKVGSYIGNNNVDGTFVYTSFAPAFILWKNTNDAGTNWLMVDNKRDTFNPNDDFLYANASTAEEEDYDVDFLSNGFKHRSSSSWSNGNGKTYIYIAFASVPFKFSNAR